MAPRPRGNVKLSALREAKGSGVRTTRSPSGGRAARIRRATPDQPAAQNRRKTRPEPRPPLRARMSVTLSRVGLDPRGRERAQGLVLHALLVITAVALVVSAMGLIERHLKTSSSFAIESVEVSGNQQLTAAQVVRAAGLAVGQNVFAVGPEEARKRLLQQPWIESASVRRRLPGRYGIEVRERRAVAIMAAGQLSLVSDEGQAFKTLEPNDPADLPVISGLDPNLRTQDEQALSSALLSAVALLHDYQDAGLSRREPISEIHVESDAGLSLYVGADPIYVRLGKAPFRQKLERLREVLTRLAKDKARAQYVYLDNQRRPDRVTARLR
jgi:cell division protein FtsQ